jgi:hypothetical protein
MKEPAEGVAAPLEPTPPAEEWANDYLAGTFPVGKFQEKLCDKYGIKVTLGRSLLAELFRAYAAAVSKNLQEELARLQSEVAVRNEWLRFADAEDLKTYRELRNQAGKSPR